MDTAVVTGGTDGIGRAIARGLAAAGVRVLVVGRDREKGEACARALRAQTSNAQVEFLCADLSLVREADRLATLLATEAPVVRYLVLCAGTLLARRVLTAENQETMFATNFLTRVVLAQALVPAVRRAADAGERGQILLVSGGAGGTIDYADPSLEGRFLLPRVVGQFCRANDLFALRLAETLAGTDPTIDVACLRLGPVKTGIRRTFPLWMKVLVPLLLDPFISQTPEEAAAAALHLLLHRPATGPEAPAHERTVLLTKIRRGRPARALAPTGVLADPAERRRLVEWAEGLAASIRSGVTGGAPSRS